MSTLGEKLYAWSIKTWPDLFLLGGLVLSLSFSIEKASWVVNAGPIHGGIFLGALTGALLVATRWKGWQAGVYAWILSLLAGAQWVGEILPRSWDMGSMSLLQWAEGVRLRGLVFGLRLAGWISAIQQGEKILLDCRRTLAEAGQEKNVRDKLLAGDPSRVIVEEAVQGHYPLILMGARGLSPLRQLLLGSVSQGVLHGASGCVVGVVYL